MKWFCDVLVVGGGGGAIRAAIAAKEAKPDSRVLLVTKGFFWSQRCDCDFLFGPDGISCYFILH